VTGDRLPPGQGTGQRLQKVLSRAGFGSRRVEAEVDAVAVDGIPVSVRSGLVYYLLNKPRGVVTTARDPQGRRTVVELVPLEPRVFPVGRLDADSEGLLLVTNDGELTHRLTHPSFGVEKQYLAEVEGTPSPAAVRRLREGVDLEDGRTAPAKVAAVSPSALRITIHEGRNRQVRRMCAAVGHPVTRLVRTRIGPLAERSLRPGEWRPLTLAEVRALNEAARPREAG
jgi:23S rRNA pseudouridine2605 synthase